MEKMRGFKLGGPRQGLKGDEIYLVFIIQIKSNFDIKSHYYCILVLNIQLTNSVTEGYSLAENKLTEFVKLI